MIRPGEVIVIPGCRWPVLVVAANADGSGVGRRLTDQFRPTGQAVPLPAGGVAAVYLYLPGVRAGRRV